MVSIELAPDQQKRLDELAQSQGQDGATLARRILLDYLDFQELRHDTEEGWGEASVALAPEIMDPENWGESGDGSK